MNEQMIVTYIIIDLFCMILAVSMERCINSDFGTEFEVKSFRRALASYCGFMLFGLIWLLTENGYIKYISVVVWVSNMCSLFLLNLTAYYWFMFAEAKLSINKSFPTKKQSYIVKIPIILTGILCLSSPFTGWVFTITQSGEYMRGPIFVYMSMLQYLYGIFVLIHAAIRCFHEKHHEKKNLYVVIGVFIIFPMSAGIIQICLSGTPIMAPSLLTAFFLVFINIQSSQIYNDALTGLNNRKRAFMFLEEQIFASGKESPVTVYMTDINSFKSINDNYGHIEGDRALKVAANALMKLGEKHHVFVARYGGDEFMIVGYGNNQESPDKIVKAFHKLLADQCKKKHLPYTLSMSIGYVYACNTDETLEQIINRADRHLYDEKHKHHGNERKYKYHRISL